ncbi:class I SAM-dependent methyltransferase [Spirulina subsalsa]|uniref:class I SAM-dependent methyltransferase n=1 Tax=Spirulina subsalsa TaxID=54311 RepID=UPI00030AF4E2|nr:class I SAM-dependent methyltransferase [Spirulina subsalsa]
MRQENKNYKVADYLARSHDFYSLNKYKIVLSWIPQQEHLRILNAGCGSGEMNLMLAQNKSWSIDAIDVDETAVALSKQLKEQAELNNLNVFHSTIEDFEPNQPYDVIVSNDVLEHIENDEQALEKLNKLLKPNGYLCLSVPAFQFLFGYHDKMLGHYRRYSKYELVSKVSLFFRLTKVRYFGFSLIPVVILYSCLLKKDYPIEQAKKKSWLTQILKKVLSWEANCYSPIGISLVLLARK